MSKPGRIYRITHQCFDDSDIQEIVDISDTDYQIDDADEVDIVPLIPAGDPVRCSVIDNSEDPFTVHRSQQLTISILSENPVNMNTFASGSDNRWAVHNYIGVKTLFKGFLVLDDMSEAFMFDPNDIILTANDGLGLLKDMPLVDFDGNDLVGEYKLIELIAFCLYRTGTPLTIKAAFNIKLSGFIDDISIPNVNDQHFFSTEWVSSKSYQNSDGTFMDMYEVLNRILGEEACVFQRQGFWWILRIDEIEHPTRGLYITEFDSDGVFVGNLGEKSFEKQVGKDSPFTIFFSREQTKVVPTRPFKSVKLTFPYDYPDLPENKDFEKGDLIDGTSPTVKTYKIDEWPAFFSNTSSDDAPTTPIYTRRLFTNDYETERYVVIEASADFNFIMSQPIKVGAKDTFILGLERRMSADTGGSGFYSDPHVQVRLYGNDGTFWTHQSKTSIDPRAFWEQCTATFRTNQHFFVIEGDLADDTRESKGLYDGESAEIPVAGTIRILLYQSSQFGIANDTYLSGLSFDYRPFINGSHGKFTGQSQEVIRTTEPERYKAKRETDVYLTDAPRPGIKGALLNPFQFVEVFSGSVIFVTGFAFKIAGYQLAKFRKGQRINVSGTTSNNFQARVTGVTYTIVGTETIITVDHATVSETDATTLVQEMSFELSSQFYNAVTQPDGPLDSTYIHPYSEIQVYDVWNQFNNDKRVFQATLQGLDLIAVDSDLLANNAHLIHKWGFSDPDEDTNDRFFQLMTFDQSHRTAEWTGVFREVFNITRDKQYLGRTFKYNS